MKSCEENHFGRSEMKNYRIPPLSPELKERVLNAGRAAWVPAAPMPTDIPWVLPMLRLAACLAIAVALVHLGNTTSKHSTARWMAFDPSPRTVSERRGSPSETMVSPLAAVAIAWPPENAPHDLLARQRRIQEMLGTVGNWNG